mmetsp:Transcript_36213/g.108492  ORF Transcript_36213/g.108492 Transcript_36213/m.108492 type:complete len:203 (+) Transcript_36213:1358-1966(+)
MRPSDLDDTLKFILLRPQRHRQLFQPGHRTFDQRFRGRNVHRRGKGIVRTLSHVAMIVRMDRRFRPHSSSEYHNGPIRQYFVHVHVGLRPASCLINHQREVTIQPSPDDLVGRRGDGIGDRRVHPSGVLIVQRAAFLERRLSVHYRQGHARFGTADGKILDRTLSLRAPERAGGDGQFAHRIGFGAGGECGDGRIFFGGGGG